MTTPATSDVELLIGGMTCASCAARVEKKLNRMEGVSATVNYATEKAKVTYDGDVAPEDLVAAVEKAGYTARLPRPRPEAHPELARGEEDGVLHSWGGTRSFLRGAGRTRSCRGRPSDRRAGPRPGPPDGCTARSRSRRSRSPAAG